MLSKIIKILWLPTLLTGLAVWGILYDFPLEIMIPSLAVLFGVGAIFGIMQAREKQLEVSSLRLRQLTSHFNRRFTGNSPLSIFTIIDNLFTTEEPKLWEWARSCDMAQRIFDSWCNSFTNRVEGEVSSHKLSVYLWTYLNELWSITNHYYQFIDQFYEIAVSIDLPRDIVEQYNRFILEYNAFAQDFRESLSELREVAKTGIDPPSVKLARELQPREM